MCTQPYYVHIATQYSNNNVYIFVLQISEELEKVKQEMEEKGSSMSDGGNPHAQQTLFHPLLLVQFVYVSWSLCLSMCFVMQLQW